MRRWMPSPSGMVTDNAFLTPFLERTQTLWPIDIPGPKLVYDNPLGAKLCIKVRTIESEPGSQPAAITLTVLVALLMGISSLR